MLTTIGRLRSISRLAWGAASTIRARDACTSASCASTISRPLSACSAARRALMSKIAPSSHRRPSPACCACRRSSAQRSLPSHRTTRYVRMDHARERPQTRGAMTTSGVLTSTPASCGSLRRSGPPGTSVRKFPQRAAGRSIVGAALGHSSLPPLRAVCVEGPRKQDAVRPTVPAAVGMHFNLGGTPEST